MNSYNYNPENCTLCPRKCGANRLKHAGFCGAENNLIVAKYMIHHLEEPCISGENPEKGGSGAIFFAFCPLKCPYCQNNQIEQFAQSYKLTSPEKLAQICFQLKEQGAKNINLITPMHFAPQIVQAIKPIKKELNLPIIINTGGFDSIEQVQIISQIADIFLPDFKYANEQAVLQFTADHHVNGQISRFGVTNYPTIAKSAIKAMFEAVGEPRFDSEGYIQRGVVIRHLVLPGGKQNAIDVIQALTEIFMPHQIMLSLMAQYTTNNTNLPPPLNRRVTTYEYNCVVKYAEKAGFSGYIQSRESANNIFTPDFTPEFT